jgi:hypothetical protein
MFPVGYELKAAFLIVTAVINSNHTNVSLSIATSLKPLGTWAVSTGVGAPGK